MLFVGNPLEEKHSAEGNWRDEAIKRLPRLKKLDGEFLRLQVVNKLAERLIKLKVSAFTSALHWCEPHYSIFSLGVPVVRQDEEEEEEGWIIYEKMNNNFMYYSVPFKWYWYLGLVSYVIVINKYRYLYRVYFRLACSWMISFHICTKTFLTSDLAQQKSFKVVRNKENV